MILNMAVQCFIVFYVEVDVHIRRRVILQSNSVPVCPQTVLFCFLLHFPTDYCKLNENQFVVKNSSKYFRLKKLIQS